MTEHLYPPLRSRKPRPRKLLRPAADGPRCENMLRHRDRAATQCEHKGRTYRVGLVTMTACICCMRKILKQANVTARLVRKTK